MTVHVPRSLDDALTALDANREATVLAGGTDLLVAVNAGRQPLAIVVTLDRVDELGGWRLAGDHVVLGAGLTYRELAEPELAALVPALAQAARTVGSPQIRN